jgi:hypothetical protein
LTVDFWTTKCIKCPAALEKLNTLATGVPQVLFLSCVLNDKEIAADIVEESGWENMTHIYIEPSVKEALKQQFGFTEVPYCIVIDSVRTLDPDSPHPPQSSCVLASGNPKSLDIQAILNAQLSGARAAVQETQPLTSDAFASDDF